MIFNGAWKIAPRLIFIDASDGELLAWFPTAADAVSCQNGCNAIQASEHRSRDDPAPVSLQQGEIQFDGVGASHPQETKRGGNT